MCTSGREQSRYFTISYLSILNEMYLYAISPYQRPTNNLHKIVWCDTCCFPLSLLLSLGPVNVTFCELSLLNICPRNFIYFFLMPIIKVLFVSIFLKVGRFSHVQSLCFSVSFCRFIFLWSQICFSSARRLASIGLHVGETILLNSVIFSYVSIDIYLFLKTAQCLVGIFGFLCVSSDFCVFPRIALCCLIPQCPICNSYGGHLMISLLLSVYYIIFRRGYCSFLFVSTIKTMSLAYLPFLWWCHPIMNPFRNRHSYMIVSL